jgi:glutaredoxin 3
MARKVLIYSTSTCPYCYMEKNYLKGKGVQFEEVLLDKEPGKIQEFIDRCGNMGVPCTHITHTDGREEHILGFDKGKLDTSLGLS